MTKPLRFENKSLRLKYKCLICIWIIFWAILDLFINPTVLSLINAPPLINAPLTYFQIKLGKMPKFLYGVSL